MYIQQLYQFAREDLPQIKHDLENASTVLTLQEQVKKLHNIVAHLCHQAVIDYFSRNGTGVPAAAPQAPPPVAQPVHYQQVQQPVGVAAPVTHYPHQQVHAHPIPAAVAPHQGAPHQGYGPSPYPTSHHPGTGVLPLPTLAGPPAVPPGSPSMVTEVTVTPQGSRVQVPGQPVAVIPPGFPVDAAALMAPQAPPQAYAVPPGYALPPGYSMPPPAVDVYPQQRQAPVAAPPVQLEGTPTQVVLPKGGGMTPEVAAALARASGQAAPDPTGGARVITEDAVAP